MRRPAPGGPGGRGRGGAGPSNFESALPRSVRVIHEDRELIIIDKPPGLLTANIPGETRTALFDMLKRYIRSTRPRLRRDRERDEDGPKPRSAGQGVYVIHRLDKEASGLLVFATSEKAFGDLKEAFKTKRVHRIYTALVEGEVGPVGQQGTIQSYLRETPSGKVESLPSDSFRGPGRAAAALGGPPSGPMGPDMAKLAVTHYRVIGVGHGMTLLQVRLETGRKHQIRVHLADRGHPLVGDMRYGAKNDSLTRLALHATELGFTHPGTGQTVRYTSFPPPVFHQAVGLEAPRYVDRPDQRIEPAGIASTPASTSAVPPFPTVASAQPAARTGEGRPADGRPGGPRIDQPGRDTSWERVAEWYDSLQGEAGEETSDHYRDVIIPGTIRLLSPAPGARLLDVACGQGVISRAATAQGARVVGVDASPSLIDAARARLGGGEIDYRQGDARRLLELGLEPAAFDAASCVMALGNIDPLDQVFRGVHDLLKPGGRFVAVISHPAFRAPGQTSWGWDERGRVQYRRVDAYLTVQQVQIQMHPGKAAMGQPGGDLTTWSFHRPLQNYVRLLGEAGLLIDAIEEWPSLRVSEPGPRAAEENRSRRELPLFLALRAIKAPRA